MKKLLASTALLTALATATPASAWFRVCTFKNVPLDQQWSMTPNVTGIVLTRVTDGFHFGTTFVPSVTPMHSAKFPCVFEPPCQYWVTVHQLAGPDITSATKMNVCTQTTVILKGTGAFGQPTPITFGP